MIRLHHVPLARSLRVMWLLEELGLDYEVAYYSIRDGSMRSPEFLALSPAGRVPVLERQGAVWFESGAIVQLLCETYPEAGLLPAPGSPERARAGGVCLCRNGGVPLGKPQPQPGVPAPACAAIRSGCQAAQRASAREPCGDGGADGRRVSLAFRVFGGGCDVCLWV